MEQKKLPQADLERRRTTGFLLGLVLVLALFFVAFEFDMAESSAFDANALLDADDEEAELMPLFKQEEQLVLLAPEEQTAPAEKLNIVEEEVELQPEELNVENTTEGEGEEQTVEEMLKEMGDIEPPEVNPRDNPERFRVVLNEDGSITDIKITKPLHPQCDREAIRVLRSMPRWSPGIENDKPCRTRVCIPIVFKL